MDAVAEVRHEMPKGTGLPFLVERLEALGNAVGRRCNLIGIDGVALFRELRARQTHRIPEDEGSPGDGFIRRRVRGCGRRLWQGFDGSAPLEMRGFNRVHTIPC